MSQLPIIEPPAEQPQGEDQTQTGPTRGSHAFIRLGECIQELKRTNHDIRGNL